MLSIRFGGKENKYLERIPKPDAAMKTLLEDLSHILRSIYKEKFDDRTLVSNAALSLAGILTGSKALYEKANEEKGGSRVMCEALDKLEKRGFERGFGAGKDLGRNEGRNEGIVLAKKVLRLAAEGLSEEQIAAACMVSREEVAAVLMA